MITRYQEKLSDFDKALNRLNEAIIQRFEFCYEICWKVMKMYLENEGIEEAKSPRSTFREAFKVELIDDGEAWIDMLKDRNLTSHVYDEEMAIEIYEKIIMKYYPQMKEMCSKLKKVVE